LWESAKLLIYPNQRWTVQQERKALNAIWTGVYGGFQADLNDEQWEAFHQKVLRRIELVKIYLDLHSNYQVAMPYAEIIPGKGYFDRENANGFRRSLIWWESDQKRTQQWELGKVMSTALLQMGQRQKLDKGLKVKLTKRSHVHIKTLHQLHTYHRTILRRIGGEAALNQFATKLKALRIISIPS
jgi:hypothetical protein